MHPLDYRAPAPSRRTPYGRAALVGLPIAAMFVLAVVVCHSALYEPFFGDPAAGVLQVGGPAVVMAIWIGWFILAVRRRVQPPVFIAVACWAAANVWVAGWLAVGFFKEPW